MICIYHSKDLDGFSSAAIVKRWHDQLNDYPDNVGKGELKLIGYDYGQPVPFNLIPEGEKIIMVDVSFDMPDMLKLAKHSKNQLTWIDHHISKINDYKAFVGDGETFLKAVLENGIAACEGTWKYLFPDFRMPRAIELLGEYDTWRNGNKQKWEEQILPFQFGMRLYCNSPETFPQEIFSNPTSNFVHDTISAGKTVLQYQAQVNKTQCRTASFEMEFEGLRAICLNCGGFNSDLFKSVYDESKHDIMMPFQFNGKYWTISLYSIKKEIDCSSIAKKYNGGGHRSASGFQVKDIRSIFGIIE